MPVTTTSSLHTNTINPTHLLLTARARNPALAPTDFRNILHAVVEAGRLLKVPQDRDNPLPSTAILPAFSMHFLLTVINGARIRLESVHLGSAGGWRRATQVVKNMHYTLKTYGRASRMFLQPIEPIAAMCDAIATGLWMDEDCVECDVVGEETRNDYMTGLMRKVGYELKALSDKEPTFYDFLPDHFKQGLYIIMQLLIGEGQLDDSGWTRRMNYHRDGERKKEPEHKPFHKEPEKRDSSVPKDDRAPLHKVPHQLLLLPPPPPTPETKPPSHEQTVQDTAVSKHHDGKPAQMDIRAFLVKLLSLSQKLADNIINQQSEFVFTAIDCFHQVLHQAICSIDGTDIANEDHWNRLLCFMEVIQQTALDLAHWSIPLHKGLSSLFFAIYLGMADAVCGADKAWLHPDHRYAALLAVFAGVGQNLDAVTNANANFYAFLGPISETALREMIVLLKGCDPLKQ